MGGGGTYGHAKEPGCIVLEGEVLVGKGLGAVDGGAASAVAVEEVATLDHEIADLKGVSKRTDEYCVFKGSLRGEGRTIRWNLLPL